MADAAKAKKIGKAIAWTLFFAVLLGAGGYGVYQLAGKMGFLPAESGAAPDSGSSIAEPSSQEDEPSEGNASHPATESGIFAGSINAARSRMENMSLRDKVGQVFVFQCPWDGQIKFIDDYQPGGYCLMGRDFEGKTADQVREMTAAYQKSSKIPMLLCCDEEGGTVVRVSSNSDLAQSKFASPRDLFAQGGLDVIEADTKAKAELLKSLGINMNLAPVVDISTNPSDFMYSRSLGQGANTTASFARLSVRVYNEKNIACALKHFPGYGNTADTHTGMAVDKRSMETFQNNDFVPFRDGIHAGAPCILMSHNVVECMDAEKPATLSPRVHEILREELGFTGVIMTDDLSMKAIPEYTGGKNACVAAFLAGNDILLTSGGAADFDALYQAVQDGTVSEERLNESVVRILAMKMKMGIMY